MAQHSKFSPSGAHIWGRCPAYVSLPKQRQTDTSKADEGTTAHEVARLAVTGQELPPVGYVLKGVVVTQEMLDGARVYSDAVLTSGELRGTEVQVDIPQIPGCWGTVDAYTVSTTGELTVWDYKFGWGAVDVYQNPQLMLYAEGLRSHALTSVTLGIVQPRPYHPQGPVRTYTLRDEDAQVVIDLQAAACSAGSPQPEARTGPHCRYCRAKLSCPAYGTLTRAAMDELRVSDDPEAPTVEQLGRELTALRAVGDVLKARTAAVEAELTTKIQAGQRVPGWHLAPGRATYKWSASDSELEALGGVYGIELFKRSPVTPKQAEKAGLPKKLVERYSTKTTGLTLSPITEASGQQFNTPAGYVPVGMKKIGD